MFRYSLKDPAAKIDPLKMLKKEIQQQLESIEQTANAYFDKVESYEDFHDFNSLDSDEREQSSELREQIANLVGELLNASAHSSLFDQLDQQTLRDALRRAHAALRLCRYQQWDAYEIADEDILKAVVQAGHREYPTSVSEAREEFMEGLDAIGQILTRIPDEVHEETGTQSAGPNDSAEKSILSVKEFAEQICKSSRTVKRYVTHGIIKANQNDKGRILNIPRSELDSFLNKKE